MIELHTLKPSQARHHPKRVGRGNSSGKGTTAGRGTKGQRARTGGRNKTTRRALKALIERTPKTRGFRTRRDTLETVTILQLQSRFSEGQIITPVVMHEAGLISRSRPGVKVVGNAVLKKKLTVKAQKFSAGAKAAITSAGGTAVALTPQAT